MLEYLGILRPDSALIAFSREMQVYTLRLLRVTPLTLSQNRLVPVFSPDYDSFESIRQRSSFLFDTIVAFGYKVRIGSEHHGLFLHLRRRISHSLMLSLPSSSLETLQALLILVCYWEHSWIFMDLALSMARDLSLPEAVEDSMTLISTATMIGSTAADKELFRKARLCCAVYVLDQMLVNRVPIAITSDLTS